MKTLTVLILITINLIASVSEVNVNRFNDTRSSGGEVVITIAPNGEVISHQAKKKIEPTSINQKSSKMKNAKTAIAKSKNERTAIVKSKNERTAIVKSKTHEDEILFFLLHENKQAKLNFKDTESSSYNFYMTKDRNTTDFNDIGLQDNTKFNKENTTKGICQFKDEIEVTSVTKTILNNCIINNKYAEVILILTPTTNALIATIEEVIIDDKALEFDKTKSMVLNKKGSKENIATFINTRQNENNLNVVKEQLASGASEAVTSSYSQLQKSNTEATRSVDANGNSIVVENTVEPDLLVNMAYGIGNGLVKSVEVLSKLGYKDLPYKYLIVKNTKIKLILRGIKNEKNK